MNTRTNKSDADHPADALLIDWIREAGDTPMTPRSEHVAELKERLIARSHTVSQDSEVAPLPLPAKGQTRRGWLWAALASAAALVVLSLYPGNVREHAAWAQVRKAVNGKPWLHTRTTFENGMAMESWFSPPRLVAATKSIPATGTDLQGMTPFAMFVDIRQGARFEYRPQSDEVIKSPMLDSDETSMRMVVAFFSAFADGKDLRQFAEANPDITINEQREVAVDGRPFLEFETVVSFQGRESVCTYRVDPTTNLPVSLTHEVEGKTLVTSIDYPEEGPESIYGLGVRQDVVVQDRMPAPELSRLLDQRQQARMNFDRYYGIAIQVPPDEHWSNSVRVNRLWRDGKKWRTEYMIWDVADSKRIQSREAPADGTDPLEWWSAQLEHERFRPTTLSDGTHTWRFEYDSTKSETNPERWEYTVKPATQNPYPINPKDPLPTILEFPEFMAYGPTGLPSSRRQGTLTLQPEDGPEGTVLIESRTTNEPRPQGNHLSYFWVDPLENGMMRQTQMLSVSGEQSNLLGEKLVLETARSPKGYLYPARLKHMGGAVTHFYLDFDADFDDSVFDSALNEAAPSPR